MANEGANAVAIQSDGKIVVVGVVDHYEDADFALARYNRTVRLTSRFDGNGKKIRLFRVGACLCSRYSGGRKDRRRGSIAMVRPWQFGVIRYNATVRSIPRSRWTERS